MSRDQMARSMQPIGQADSRRARQGGGAGLGLPLAGSLVELQGGRLALQSGVGAGTLATIRFPPEPVGDTP